MKNNYTNKLMDTNALNEDPECSHGSNIAQSSKRQRNRPDDKDSIASRELAIQSLDQYPGVPLNNSKISNKSLTFLSVSLNEDDLKKFNLSNVNLPLYIIKRPRKKSLSELAKEAAAAAAAGVHQPKTLFLLALSMLNKDETVLLSSVDAIQEHLSQILGVRSSQLNVEDVSFSRELTAPNSCMSAPPSYSYVMRQIQARARRPRLVGTFIPSPSFIPQCPPPAYAASYDIYIDSTVNRPPVRVFNFGFTPVMVVCPECGYAGMTVIHSKITLCTHLCAFLLCLFCCWVCVPLPYMLTVCKDVYHYCGECRNFLGMYCPTNPEVNTAQRVANLT